MGEESKCLHRSPPINIFPASDHTESGWGWAECNNRAVQDGAVPYGSPGKFSPLFAPLMFFSCVIGTLLYQEHYGLSSVSAVKNDRLGSALHCTKVIGVAGR